MEILRVNLKNPSLWDEAVRHMKEVLEKDGIVLFPTDTVYGIGCNALSEAAVQKIFICKRRDEKKPLPVFVRDIAQARSCASINKTQEAFLKKSWPGKLTAVLKKRPEIPRLVTRDEDTIGLRVPAFPLINSLMKSIDFPIAQTSANISGEDTFSDGSSAYAFFREQPFRPDLIIDAGVLPLSKPSTVVDLVNLVLLRKGAVSEKIIYHLWEECLHER